MKPYLSILLVLFLPFLEGGPLYAQKQGQALLDSQLAELPKMKEDTNKVRLLKDISFSYNSINPDTGIKYGRQCLQLAEKLGWKKGMAYGYNLIGVSYMQMSDYTLALQNYSKALKINEEINYKKGIIANLGNIAAIYQYQSNYPQAIEYGFKAIKMAEEVGYKNLVAINLLNIGINYNYLGNYPIALENEQKALKMNEELGDDNAIALDLINIGNVYQNEANYPMALDCFVKSLKIAEAVGNKNLESVNLLNAGTIYQTDGDYSKALEYYMNSLKITEEIGDKKTKAINLENIGVTYYLLAQKPQKEQNNDHSHFLSRTELLKKALIYTDSAITIVKELGTLNYLIGCNESLAIIDSMLGDYKGALAAYKQSRLFKDSIFSQENNKKIAQLEGKRQEELNEKKMQVQQLQIVAAKNERKYYLAGMAILVILSGGLLGRFRGLRRNKKQLEEKNRIIAAEKENADMLRVRAENSEQFKQQFLANMSHEIRTPMNAVSGMTELLLDKSPRPDQLNYLQVISKSSDVLLHIINDILDLSKIEVGKLELESIDFSLADTVKQVKETLSFRAEEKGLQLITQLDDDMNDVLMGDPYRLNQVLINLGGNAIKFTERGSVEINIKKKKEENGKLSFQFSVTDTGIGIPADKIHLLFESFKQVQSSDTRKYGGTGLGLSISKQLVELQGGSIAVESSVGSGTTFSFIISYPPGSKEKLRNRMQHERIADGSMLKGLRILLADDNEYNRLVVTETLHAKADVIIDEALNGADAVKMMQQNDYDVVLMDVQMPEMNGFEATQRIREMAAPKNSVPVIGLTASLLRADIDMCLKYGMNTYVPKPFKAWQLVSAIAEQTGRKQTSQPLTEQRVTEKPLPVTMQNKTAVHTDLAYLSKFCEGDEDRMKKYMRIFIVAVPVFKDKVNAALAEKDLQELAGQVHAFKPKWMMMGMKQSTELGQKIEALCKAGAEIAKITAHINQLVEQNINAVKELENKC